MFSVPNLTGRTFLVTGANTGIGRTTALALARAGGHVILACRSEDKAKPVMDEIAAGGAGSAEPVALDLGSLASVRRCAAAVLAMKRPLHVLINNAGLTGRGLTEDGFELTFGVNHLGPFLLTTLLLDRLKESAPARIVNVSSRNHYRCKGLDFEAFRRTTASVSGVPEYSASKLANVLFTHELSRRLEGTGVTAYSLHPGVIASDIWRRIPWPIRPLVTFRMKTVEEGAETTLYCATSDEALEHAGGYFDDCRVREPSRLSLDRELAERLWRESEAWTSGS